MFMLTTPDFERGLKLLSESALIHKQYVLLH